MLRAGMWVLVVLLFFPIIAFGQERGLAVTRKLVSSPLFEGEHRALVIGNDDYRDPKGLWGPLKTAVNDAEAVAAVLEKDYGFDEVRLLKNATRREMIQAFNKLAEQSKENDSVLIYYAGHGYLREETGEGFWIPVDAEGRDDSTYVPNAVIKTKISIIADRAKHVLLISDSCFAGDLLRGGNRGVGLDAKTERYYRKVARRKSVQVLAAGGLEFVDDDYKGTGHSPFTYYFLEELKFNEEPLLETTNLSQAVAQSDPAESKKLEAKRDSAATNALLAGAVGVGFVVWAFQSGGEEVAAQKGGWGVEPVVEARSGEAVTGFLVRYRW